MVSEIVFGVFGNAKVVGKTDLESQGLTMIACTLNGMQYNKKVQIE